VIHADLRDSAENVCCRTASVEDAERRMLQADERRKRTGLAADASAVERPVRRADKR
jgi:hypothetical protein